jgi:class 3 adenylate cyclase
MTKQEVSRCADTSAAAILTECSLETVSRKHVQEVIGIQVGTVIISNGDLSWFGADVNALSAVYNVSNFGTCDVAGCSSSREFVGISRWTVVEKTVRCLAIVLTLTT